MARSDKRRHGTRSLVTVLAAIVGFNVGVRSAFTEPNAADPGDAKRRPEAATPETPVPDDGPLRIGGGTIDVRMPAEAFTVPRANVLKWIQTGATAVSQYYGRFPVKQVRIDVQFTRRGKVHGGTTYDGRKIVIHLGRDTTAADLADDWMITHEMFHLGFPDLDDTYLWMEEGLSDYLEPLARARIGTLTDKEVWKGFVEGMPKGQPERGDQGLDRTHSWGRTYWGGAIFWLLADVQIREKTSNRRSADDAVRAILDAGGDGSEHWALAKVLEVGDHATGTTVLKDLHEQLGGKSVTVDLDSLWTRLGVKYQRGEVSFDDRAPLAAIRQSMTQPPAPKASPKGPASKAEGSK